MVGIENIETQERDLELGPEEVLVKTHRSGICGSDKNLYNGIIPPAGGLNTEMRTPFSYPYFLGHEGGGTVKAVGEKVREFKPGDKVMAFAWVETFSDYFKAGEKDLEKAPEELNLDLASLGEPIACAVFSGLMSQIQLGDVVAIFGMGFAGQIMAQVVKQKGAFMVIGIDILEGKLALAQKLGVDQTINADRENPVEGVLDLTKGQGADVVVEMAGTAESVNMCTAAVKHNGVMVFYSWITQDVTINISRWHNNSLKVINTGLVHNGIKQRRIWTPEALRPVVRKQINVEPLITHRFPLDKIKEAFKIAANDPAAVKVVVEP